MIEKLLQSIPLPFMGHSIKTEELEGFKTIQRLAYEAVITVGDELQEGWTEKQTVNLIETFLRDNGVKAFFHEPYAWFGERTRFDGINRKHYRQFGPTNRHLEAKEVVILDVAPILNGYIGDIGYTLCLTKNPKLKKAMGLLRKFRKELPRLFDRYEYDGAQIWKIVDHKIKAAGYDNIHKIYPFQVLGHRVEHVPFSNWALKTPVRFSLHSFWQVLSGGLFPQLLSPEHHGDMSGMWAIEPHIGGKGFGAKFEEILVVDPDVGAYWLDDNVPHLKY